VVSCRISSNRPEIFSLVSAILSEREEGSELSGGELNLLSESINLVMRAKLAIAQEKQEAERAARLQALAEQSANLLAEAEAILTGVPAAEKPAEGEAEAESEPEAAATEEIVEPEAETATEEIAPEAAEGNVTESLVEAEPETPAVDEPVVAAETPVSEEGELTSVLGSVVQPKKPKKKAKKRLKAIVVEKEGDLNLDSLVGPAKKKPKTKRRALKHDDTLTRATGKRVHKKGDDDWDELDELEY